MAPANAALRLSTRIWRPSTIGIWALFLHLKAAAPGVFGTEALKWNFTKFLIDRDGEVVCRFGSADGVAKIEPQLLRCLARE